MIVSVRGILAVMAYDQTDRPIAEVNLAVRATPGPDGWTLDVARPSTPEHSETVAVPDVEATVRQVLAALYPEGLLAIA